MYTGTEKDFNADYSDDELITVAAVEAFAVLDDECMIHSLGNTNECPACAYYNRLDYKQKLLYESALEHGRIVFKADARHA